MLVIALRDLATVSVMTACFLAPSWPMRLNCTASHTMTTDRRRGATKQ
jgi:hypothetical protein